MNVPVALASADCMRFSKDNKPIFSAGDFWLNRLPSGEEVGYRDDRHVLLVSGTMSGKGASVIIPNLCLWRGSAVVIDPKGENAMVPARRRGNGSSWCHGLEQAVYILDPFGEVKTDHDDFADLRSGFNPIDLICAYPAHVVDDAARMADALIVSDGGTDNFFDDTAREIVKGLILHIASSQDLSNNARHLLSLRRMLLAGDEGLSALAALNDDTRSGMSFLFARMRANPAYNGVVSRMGVMMAELLEASPRTLLSALQVARTQTGFLDSPALHDCLKSSSFRLSELKTRRTSLYLCLPQRYMSSHFRWLRLMTTLILGEMERVRATPKHPLLFVLDEFPALGRLKSIENAAAQIAGYGVKLMFVAQTLAQLKDTYKDNWETLVANAGLKLFFGNDDHFTREYVSKLIGEREVQRWTNNHSDSASQSQNRGFSTQKGKLNSNTDGWSSSVTFSNTSSSATFGQSSSQALSQSTSTSHNSGHGSSQSRTSGATQGLHKRYLLTPDEVGRLFGNRAEPMMLALPAGMQPLALKHTMYFNDSYFLDSYAPHPAHPTPPTIAQRKAENDLLWQETLAVIERQKHRERIQAEKKAAQDLIRYQLAVERNRVRIVLDPIDQRPLPAPETISQTPFIMRLVGVAAVIVMMMGFV